MITVKDILSKTDFNAIVKEITKHYGIEFISNIESIYDKLMKISPENNSSNMILFIRTLKENEEGDEDIVVDDFDSNDTTLMFDVCGEDDNYDGLYSIASSNYENLLSYYIDQSTVNRFSYSQILAHILWELDW